MERSYFFDSTETEQRIYYAQDFAKVHAQMVGNGVSNSPTLRNLDVQPMVNMQVLLGSGYMFINGFMYENTSSLTLEADPADATVNRIDRVVIRFDNNPTERRIYAYIKRGLPATSPVPPNLERTQTIYEMSVAQLYITAGKSFIAAADILDERPYDSVCGYIPLHNIYRGLKINEYGNIIMPNQSYVQIDSEYKIPITDRTDAEIPISLDIEYDNQNEVNDNNRFVPKADGTYFFWAYLAFDERVLYNQESNGKRTDVQLNVQINDEYQTNIIARSTADLKDNIYIGSNVMQLKAGDEMRFVTFLRDINPEGITSRNHRITIAKIN